ncbi:transposase, Ptta/En/Spm, transposase, Tnp1/En/Spm-like protein [Tanacetum coccineum]
MPHAIFHPLLPSNLSLVELLNLNGRPSNSPFYNHLFQIQIINLNLGLMSQIHITAFVAIKEWTTSSARPGVGQLGDCLEEEVDKLFISPSIDSVSQYSSMFSSSLPSYPSRSKGPQKFVIASSSETTSTTFAFSLSLHMPPNLVLDGCPDLLAIIQSHENQPVLTCCGLEKNPVNTILAFGDTLHEFPFRITLCDLLVGCWCRSIQMMHHLEEKVPHIMKRENHRYHSEEYFDDAHEDDENNHSNGNVVKRGITRLYKFRMEYGKPGGVKLSVTFDALNRISGKHRALFSSFLGDMVREHIGLKILAWNKVGSEARDKLWDEITRYFDVDLTVRKLVMNRLGQLLRNFRTKLRRTYILPNQDTPSKLNEVPAKYTAILKAEEWVNFVKYTATQAYKVKSAAGKMARSKCLYPHTMGRGGYTHVKEQMIEKKEIKPDEEPSRGTLWLKGRVNEDEDYPDDKIRSVGDKLNKIKEGTLKVDQGTDAITVVLGKEKGGYARGVGSSVTYKRYFDLPRSKQAVDERILLLQSQLDAARRERQEKELLIQSMSSKMSQTEGLMTKLKTKLAAQGGQLQSMPTQLTPPTVSLVGIHPVNSSADEEGKTTVETVKSVGAEKTTRSIRKDYLSQDSQSKEKVSVLPQNSTIIAEGTVYKSDGKIMLHNKALPKDSYKVSIDKSLMDAAFIPDVGNNGCTTVLDAETPPSTIQMITGENKKTAPNYKTIEKTFTSSSDAIKRKLSSKALVY